MINSFRKPTGARGWLLSVWGDWATWLPLRVSFRLWCWMFQFAPEEREKLFRSAGLKP